MYGFTVKSSLKKNKKVDVYDKNSVLLSSIGHIDYSDYPTYMQTHNMEYAEIVVVYIDADINVTF